MTEETLSRIKSRGYWFINIRPLEFEENRLDSLEKCTSLVEACNVRLRGWDYPHFKRDRILSGINWVQLETDWEMYKEFWRMYQSGQFVHFFGCREDWWQESSLASERVRSLEGPVLSVLMTLFNVTEIYEFASRLTEKGRFDEGLKLTIELHKMEGRRLIFLDPERSLFEDYVCAVDDLPRTQTFSAEDILGKGHDLALDHTIWIFERFNWRSSHIREILADDQRRFLEGRF